MKKKLVAATFTVVAISVCAQGPPPRGGGQGPGARQHTANEARSLDLVPANRNPPGDSEVAIAESATSLQIVSNGLPDHKVGRFPNRDNPNEISEQNYDIVIPADPEPAVEVTYLHGNPNGGGQPGEFRVFGVTFDGVLMEPGTAESYLGQRQWSYEALGGAVPLGLDTNYGHVQPDGHYHYHGLPIDLMKRLGYTSGNHSPMLGWAADGFPVYAMYGFTTSDDPDSGVVELKTSWQLKRGDRPSGSGSPGGEHDGAFVQDYEFVAGSGDLDECNGRFCVTPDFPEGTYAYFLTRDWPVIPRAFRGTPVSIGGERMRRDGPSGRESGPPPDRRPGAGPPRGGPPPRGRPPER